MEKCPHLQTGQGRRKGKADRYRDLKHAGEPGSQAGTAPGTNSFCHHSDIGITGERKAIMKKEIVVGVTGASGAIYARRLLEVICKDARVHIIVSDVAEKIAAHEGVVFDGLNAE